MKKRSRNTPVTEADAERRYGAIADAVRAAQVSSSWDRAMGSARSPSSTGVKLHPGWDAAFRRARAS
ncbi:hypothetical protein ABH944_007785 [Caballeronia udeis]|uniref:Uncharacterized protein n=1 Tax=Caballeronia udeis TaxID=1232866 RepID=A0ABW8N0F9_9BURK